MRTTVTLDPDTEHLVRRRMRERGMSFKEAINDAIRSGAREGPTFRTETASMGRSSANLDRALQIAAELDDDDRGHRLRTGS